MKGAHKFAEELETSLNLATPEPLCSSHQVPDKRIRGHQLKQHLKKAVGERLKKTVEDQG